MAVYAAMIHSMDQGIGKVLEKLDQRNLTHNTVVIFLSDNGACAENVRPDWYDVPSKTRDGRPVHVGNNPKITPGPEESYQSYGPAWANVSNTPFRRFKHWTEEGGIATPFLLRYPALLKTPNQIQRHTPGHVIDLVPTLLDLAKVQYPTARNSQPLLPLEGKSLVPLLLNQPFERNPLFWEHEGNRAVRVGDWKLLAPHAQPWQLYNLKDDPTELTDLAPQHPDKVKQLQSIYDQWAQRAGVEPWPVRR